MVDTVFYAEMAATALELISQYGRSDLVLTRQIGTTYDPAEDIEVPGTALTQPMNCIVLPIDNSPADGVEAQTLIKENMRMLKVAASGLVFLPAPGDQVTIDSSRWIVLGVTPISPAGVPLLYEIPIKRG